ncbi:MAG: DUF1294 domain-containing protein [Culicoidibacterales bacterium]
MRQFLLGYLAVMNVIGFGMMWLDKAKAKRDRWRIPEATLHSTAWLGAAPLMLVARQKLRHKSRKWQFGVSFSLASLLWLSIILLSVFFF